MQASQDMTASRIVSAGSVPIFDIAWQARCVLPYYSCTKPFCGAVGRFWVQDCVGITVSRCVIEGSLLTGEETRLNKHFNFSFSFPVVENQPVDPKYVTRPADLVGPLNRCLLTLHPLNGTKLSYCLIQRHWYINKVLIELDPNS